MLRIIHSSSQKLATISLDGKLLHDWVDEVRSAVGAAQAEGLVRLDLSGLTFADESGLALLKQLQSDGVELLKRSALLVGLMDRLPIARC